MKNTKKRKRIKSLPIYSTSSNTTISLSSKVSKDRSIGVKKDDSPADPFQDMHNEYIQRRTDSGQPVWIVDQYAHKHSNP